METRGGAPAATDVTLADVAAAADRIAPYLPRTPLVTSRTLSRMTGATLRLKTENLQRTGSFKVRGALNAILQLGPEQRARGVVTFSAGNHGQGLAYAASLVGVPCTVFMSEHAVPAKVEAIRGYGAETRFGPDIDAAFRMMGAYQEEAGAYLVHPFADPAIIAGQGTVALELIEEFPALEQVVVPVGGGGLISGVALTIKALQPQARVVGVEPVGAAVVSLSLQAGRPLRLEQVTTIADGLGAPFAAELTQRLIERHVDDVVLVTDDEIVAALHLILGRAKLLVEPAGAAAVAALLTNKAAIPHGANTAAILSGGNIDLPRLKGLL